MKSADIRTAFLAFFASKGHTIVPSSPLIPANDPTLLFTNAGMVQFKECFLGIDKRDYTRATSSQRVVRAGGKHNDLENVGYTERHHTFFEMLGNFSFGDYFKKQAIDYAWEFITQVLKLPVERLWVTVHHTDQEAEDLWVNHIGFDPKRISKLGDEDNFWQMGDTGPCGTSSEIFYDHGEQVAGGPPGSPEENGDRFTEFWNLVFMQYDKNSQGVLTPLASPSVDTGMGFERMAAIMQGVHSNYHIDLFQNLMTHISEIIGFAFIPHTDAHNSVATSTKETQELEKSLRVVADHIRAVAFLMVDGISPSNEGRGYVLRRIMRRAMRHGYKLGAQPGFFAQCLAPLITEMGVAYPELITHQKTIEKLIAHEEQQFQQTLDQGLKILEEDINRLNPGQTTIGGETLFTLYDTYGFPVDLTADIARERGLGVDIEGFTARMEEQKNRSRSTSQFSQHKGFAGHLEGNTLFTGFDKDKDDANIYKLFVDGHEVERQKIGEEGILVAQQSPFYAEAGGQVGDIGTIRTQEGVFLVKNTTKQGSHHLHHGIVESGEIVLDTRGRFEVDFKRRDDIRKNHSATHLLHAALRKTLGEHVNQKGSHVDNNRLRFDFSHTGAMSPAEILAVESLVNQHIIANMPVQTEIMSIADAQTKGAMALFDEKYDDQVRVLTMGLDNYSIELCGGTHVKATGDIGLFKITSETGTASGVRRVEAVTGMTAYQLVQQLEQTHQSLAQLLKTDVSRLEEKAEQLVLDLKNKDIEIDKANKKIAVHQAMQLVNESQLIGDVKVLVRAVEGIKAAQLRDIVEQLKQQIGEGIILLAIEDKAKVQLCAGVTSGLTRRLKAGDLVKYAAQFVDGKGGGRPDIAMAGGADPSRIHEALVNAEQWLNEKLSSEL